MRDLLLHIGLMKSGTTTLQKCLYNSRKALLGQGIEYLDLGQYNQMLGLVEVLQVDPVAVSRFPPGLNKHHREIEQTVDGLWRRLVERVESSDARRVVISAENLVYAGPETVRRLKEAFAPRLIRVLITHRPASVLVPSNYQQQARVGTVGAFDDWCRRELGELCSDEPGGSLASLRLEPLRALWTHAGGDVTFVDTSVADSSARMWSAATGLDGATLPALSAPALNASMPAEFTLALQQFLRSHRRLTVAQVREVAHRAHRNYLERVGAAGYRWQLDEALAEQLDFACEVGADITRLEGVRAQLASGAVVRLCRQASSTRELHDLAQVARKEIDRANRVLLPARAYRAIRAVRRQ